MPCKVELFDDVEAAAADAGTALERASQPALFDRIDWLRLTARLALPEARPCIARARGEDGAAAWLWLAADGRAASALASWYTLAFRAVGDTGAPLRAIARRLRGRFATIALAPMAATDAAATAQAFRAAGWIALRRETTGNWIADVAGLRFADWWARRPAKLRETLRRKRARTPLDIGIYTRFEEGAWRVYEQVYAASWKPGEGAPAFLRALAEQEGAAGTLRLGIARAGGVPVAAQFWLVEHGVATIHKLAYDTRAHDLSPGTQLSAAMFARAIDEDRVARIDYGTGDDAYKADWMDRRLPLYRLDLFDPRSPRGALAAARACSAAALRLIARR